MKIKQVNIKKFKCIEDFDAVINGAHVLLLGDNGVGKSSFIQFIEIALGKSSNIPQDAEGEGYVVTDRHGKEYTFQVKFKDGKPVVTIISPDGLKDNRKSTLASLVGAIDFDIDEFVELSKSTAGRKKQVEIFKSFLPEDIRIELSKYEIGIASNYEERTDVNRRLKETEGAIKSHPLNGQDLSKIEYTDVKAVATEVEELRKKNEKFNNVIQRSENRKTEIQRIDSEIEEFEKKIRDAKDKQKELIQQEKDAQQWMKENPFVDLTKKEKIIVDASEDNLKFEQAKTLKELIEKKELLSKESEEITKTIDSDRQAIRDTIMQMESPVSGLSYDDDTLVYKGVPVSPDNLSTSEIMELGVKLRMVDNPELGILFLQRGESLGKKRFEEILALCDANGWELIMENVERGTEKLKIELIGS